MNRFFSRKLAPWATVFLFSALSSPLWAFNTLHSASQTNPDFHIPRISESIVIDAELNEAAWAKAKVIQLNNVNWPDENIPAPVYTEALVMEDGETLYVAFKAKDPEPEKIKAFLTDRDENWSHDRVSVKIDSYNDQTLAYQFYINALGTQSDTINNQITGRESDAWDAIWDSAGKLTNTGYQVEVALPLRIFNFNEQLDIQNWGMEFIRFYPRDKDMRISHLNIDHGNSCWLCQMPTFTGFEGAKQGNNLSVIPTFVGGKAQTRNPEETMDWSSDNNTDVGLDVKWGITPDITLNGTLNPDFSQVEADAGQLTVNDTFALHLQEKRSFFLENQDYFSAPVNLIYTRNINAPDYGAKLTGKMGDHSVAAFIANDQSTSMLLPGNLGSDRLELEESSVNTALRYRYAVNEEFAVGAISTTRKSDNYHNNLLSIDSKYRPTENDTFDLQYAHSDTDMSQEVLNQIQLSSDGQFNYNEQSLRAHEVNGTDDFLRIRYRHENRDWYGDVKYIDTGKNFRADLAFFNTTDTVKKVVGGGLKWTGNDDTWWSRMRLNGDWDITESQAGEKIEQEWEAHYSINGPMQSFVRFSYSTREKVGPRFNDALLAIDGNTNLFDEVDYRLFFEFSPTTNVWLGNFLKTGKNIDYTNNRLSDVFVWEPEISWNINTHMNMEAEYQYQKMSYEGQEVFTANLLDFRLTYQFSARSFLQLTTVYSYVDRNLDNYIAREDINTKSKNMSSQLLYSYKLNPQTLFFLGYSENAYQNDELNALVKDARSVFMKMSYAWLM